MTTGDPLDRLVDMLRTARTQWPETEIRKAMAEALNEPMHQLSLDKGAIPRDLPAFLSRVYTPSALPRTNQPPPVAEVLAICEPTAPVIPIPDGVALARQAIAHRRTA